MHQQPLKKRGWEKNASTVFFELLALFAQLCILVLGQISTVVNRHLSYRLWRAGGKREHRCSANGVPLYPQDHFFTTLLIAPITLPVAIATVSLPVILSTVRRPPMPSSA